MIIGTAWDDRLLRSDGKSAYKRADAPGADKGQNAEDAAAYVEYMKNLVCHHDSPLRPEAMSLGF
jgi:hypothetical protein